MGDEDELDDGADAFRFGVAFGMLGGLVVALAAATVIGILIVDRGSPTAAAPAPPSAAAAAAAPAVEVVGDDAGAAAEAGAPVGSAYERAVARDAPLLAGITFSEGQAAAFGLRIVSNGFDNLDPPDPAVVFRYPLPGQTPRSALVREFFGSGFIVGRAQSYLRADDEPGRFGVVVWAFADTEGARRAFRAYRDLTGKPTLPSDFAPVATLVGDDGAGVSELLWVSGRALIRATYAVSDSEGAVDFARAAQDAVAAQIDEHAQVFADDADPDPSLASARSFDDRLRVLRVPELDLPGGISTLDPGGVLGGTFRDVSRGSAGATLLERRLAGLGFQGGETQRLRAGVRGSGTYGLAAYAFPDEAAARRALAEIRRHAGAQAAASAMFPGAFTIGGPDPLAYSDVYWQRGALVLQAGMYAPRSRAAPARDARAARPPARRARVGVVAGLASGRPAAQPAQIPIERPPSIGIATPVTQSASSLAR